MRDLGIRADVVGVGEGDEPETWRHGLDARVRGNLFGARVEGREHGGSVFACDEPDDADFLGGKEFLVEGGEDARGADVVFFGWVDEGGGFKIGPYGEHGHWFESDDSDDRIPEIAQLRDFFGREEDLLAAEAVGFLDLDFFDGASRVFGQLSGDAGGDLGFFAVEVDVATSFWFLPLEYDEAFYGDAEAGAEF